MSGIYLHIPFCRKACHYCDFHFSTSLKKKTDMVHALMRELELRKDELPSDLPLDTIYFGGGTPSVLDREELLSILEQIYRHFKISSQPEITLEANPDDLGLSTLRDLKSAGVNRLSIGVQSFFEEDLVLMNRSHNSEQAKQALEDAMTLFDNVSLDLIYGIPGLSMERWDQNLETAIRLRVPHISSYALTVEPRTALSRFVAKGVIAAPDDEEAQSHFLHMVQKLENHGFVHYEISNFGLPGFFSRNNTAYWLGKPYLGIGPSAHSYDGQQRSWNLANNPLYIKAISQGELPLERERLSTTDRYNEYVMTGLRTIWGVSAVEIEERFGETYARYFTEQVRKPIEAGWLQVVETSVPGKPEGHRICATREGKFLIDGIASDLFLLHLNTP